MEFTIPGGGPDPGIDWSSGLVVHHISSLSVPKIAICGIPINSNELNQFKIGRASDSPMLKHTEQKLAPRRLDHLGTRIHYMKTAGCYNPYLGHKLANCNS